MLEEGVDRRQALVGGGTSLAVGLATLFGVQRVLKTGSVNVEELRAKAEAVHQEFMGIRNGDITSIEPFQRMSEVLKLTAQLAAELKDVG